VAADVRWKGKKLTLKEGSKGRCDPPPCGPGPSSGNQHVPWSRRRSSRDSSPGREPGCRSREHRPPRPTVPHAVPSSPKSDRDPQPPPLSLDKCRRSTLPKYSCRRSMPLRDRSWGVAIGAHVHPWPPRSDLREPNRLALSAQGTRGGREWGLPPVERERQTSFPHKRSRQGRRQ
jgi:hypothetical protein